MEVDPNDRRIIYIQLTEKGRITLKGIKLLISKELREKLLLLTNEQMKVLSTASLHVKEILMSLQELQTGIEPVCNR